MDIEKCRKVVDEISLYREFYSEDLAENFSDVFLELASVKISKIIEDLWYFKQKEHIMLREERIQRLLEGKEIVSQRGYTRIVKKCSLSHHANASPNYTAIGIEDSLEAFLGTSTYYHAVSANTYSNDFILFSKIFYDLLTLFEVTTEEEEAVKIYLDPSHLFNIMSDQSYINILNRETTYEDEIEGNKRNEGF